MKNKNPLYVVKGNNVQEAKNLFDLVLKKFNLEPAFEMLSSLMKLMLSQVTSYPMFVAVKGWIDQILTKIFGLVTQMKLTGA